YPTHESRTRTPQCGSKQGSRKGYACRDHASNVGTGRARMNFGNARRVVVTGVGAVTPIGTAADGLWSGLASRRSAVRVVTRFDPAAFRGRIAAGIPDVRQGDRVGR